jgi:hypothetical protein
MVVSQEGFCPIELVYGEVRLSIMNVATYGMGYCTINDIH